VRLARGGHADGKKGRSMKSTTVIEAGPLPERIEDMPAHLAKHFF
jgi:hypothetical protein